MVFNQWFHTQHDKDPSLWSFYSLKVQFPNLLLFSHSTTNKEGLVYSLESLCSSFVKTLCKEKDLCFSDVFNNAVALDETGSSILFKSGRHLNRRWGLTSFDRINNTSVATYSDAWDRDPVWSSSPYILNLEMEQDNELKCVCVYLLPRIQICTHAHAAVRPTHL